LAKVSQDLGFPELMIGDVDANIDKIKNRTTYKFGGGFGTTSKNKIMKKVNLRA